MSSTYLDLPVTLSRPSLRGTGLPTIRLLFISTPWISENLPDSWDWRRGKTRGWDMVCQTGSQWSGSIVTITEESQRSQRKSGRWRLGINGRPHLQQGQKDHIPAQL